MDTLTPTRTHELARMKTGHGDIKTLWNPDNPAEVNEAREQFERLQREGFTIFRVDADGNKHRRMDTFDPTAEKLIAVPRRVGG